MCDKYNLAFVNDSSFINRRNDRPGIEEAGAEDHDCLTGALLELHLNGAKLAVNDADHALNLLG